MSDEPATRRSGDDSSEGGTRRSALARWTTGAVAGGLALSYGACAAMGARYLYPARPRRRRLQFVARVVDVEPGASLLYRAPTGERIAIARQGSAGTVDDFVALSSTCPHLGCQVHWEGHNERFFCPCHNGVFDPSGRAVSGPPAEAGQDLPRYELQVDRGLLFIDVPIDALARADGAEGHDPCLRPRSEDRTA